MKKVILLFSVFTLLIANIQAQEFPAPSPGKALVIFTRPPLEAKIFKFRFFDSTRYLGKIGTASYLVYECEPGKHLLWGQSENHDYVAADLKSDEVYLINAQVRTGAFQARVTLEPYDPKRKNAEKLKERLLKRISGRKEKRFNATGTAKEADRVEGTINNAIHDYARMTKKGRKIKQITPDMHL